MKKRSEHLLKRFIAYYKPHKLMFFLDLFAAFIMSVIGMGYPIVTRKIFSEYVPNEQVKEIFICAGILIGIYVLRFGLKMFVDYFGHEVGVKMQAQMRSDMFAKLQDLPYSYYDEHETGEIMSRMTNDLQNISELAHHGPENIIIISVTIVAAFIYLLTINWILALLIFACVPILAIISLSTRNFQRRAFAESKKDTATINASLESSITGIRVTKAFNNKEKEQEKFEKGNKAYIKSRMKAYFAMGIYHSSTNFVVDLFNAACIVGGGLIAINTNAFELSDYLAFAVSISLFTNPINTLLAFMEQFQDGATGFRRYAHIMDEKIEEEKEDAIKEIKLEGNIKFDNVSFSYETSDEVLNEVSFDIKKGETIALVGESGGGKTTICHLIPNFYKVTSGNITIDGININDVSLKALRDNIGIVQQDVFLFNGTIKDNILYGKLNATDEEVIEASKKANIYDYVQSLPHGFDTLVGERGVKLSGGQKQRISIARIFLKNPSILILDEATSALDNTTEILIQESLNELADGRTSIVVAHRLSTIKNADRIFVINHGRVVESGSHDDLILLNKEYAKLYNQQFRVSSFKE